MSSIQHKIQWGYYAFAAAVAGLALLAYSELTFLEAQIAPDLAASRLLDSVLEIRRYEKNWFLYGGEGALTEVRGFVLESQGLIGEARPALAGLGEAAALDRLGEDLAAYRAALDGVSDGPGPDPAEGPAALALRQAGRRLAEGAEAIARAQHAALARAVGQSRIAALSAGALAILLAVLAARWLAGRTTRPLGLLVERLQAIAEGRYAEVEPVSQDREILAVTGAVNRMLDELEARRRHLVQSEKLASLGTLVSGVAHELNNPLSNISSSCQILAEELGRVDGLGVTAGLGEWLEQIDGETERARAIVASLLDFGREGPFAKRSLALLPLVERTLRLLGPGHTKGAIELGIPAELRVDADPQRLQQVLVNLIRNALDSGGQVQPRVRVTAQRVEAAGFRLPRQGICGRSGAPQAPGGRLILIQVEDDGPGIPPEVLPRVFDPFFTTKDVGHGSGLGLYVTQEIVHQHGGCIGVESRPGEHTRFLIALPEEPLPATGGRPADQPKKSS